MDVKRLQMFAGILTESTPTTDVGSREFNTDRICTIAGFEHEPILETVETDADIFIVFESKTSPVVMGVFRSALDAKSVLKKYKRAVGRSYRTR